MDDEPGYLRIGELARRTGVSTDLLRAWERRYGLLRPERSKGGLRLYTDADERRVAAMRAHLAEGLSAAEAARLVVAREARRDEAAPEGLVEAAAGLRRALDAFDDAGAQAVLDRLFGAYTAEAVAREVLMPYLRELGERWARGEASIAQEHFASTILRTRLLSLARGWDRGAGPRALLVCPPGERHDLGLVMFGLALRGEGWRITYLGPDTPLPTVLQTARRLEPAAVVVAATGREPLEGLEDALAELAAAAPVLLGGAAADEGLARRVGARLASGDPLESARALAAAM